MSRVHYSFDSAIAAIVTKPEPEGTRVRRATRGGKLKSRQFLRETMENLGLFAFGFGATNLLIHFAIGFFYAARVSSMVPQIYL